MQAQAERETRQWSVCVCGGAPMGRMFCYEVARYDEISDANQHHEALLAGVPNDVAYDGWYPAVMNTAHPYRPFVRKEAR